MGKKLSITFALVATLILTGCHNLNNMSNAVTPTTIAQTTTSYKNERALIIDGKSLPISETSARLLTNQTGDAPELVADIYGGKHDQAVPGYEIMLIGRTSSILAEARKTERGVVDNRMIHRGYKALVGIPVENGKAMLNQAVLLDLDIIYDDPTAIISEGKNVKDRGIKLTKKDVPVENRIITIRSLTLPNYQAGENAGGGVDFDAAATIADKSVSVSANSAFQIFYTTKPDNAWGFN